MRAGDLVIMVGLFNSPKGDRCWLKAYLNPKTPINEALNYARTRPSEASRLSRQRGEREIDPYADDVIASGNWTCYTELVN